MINGVLIRAPKQYLTIRVRKRFEKLEQLPEIITSQNIGLKFQTTRVL